MSIDEVFGAGGIFSRSFPGYAARDGQVRMARACEESFRDSRTLLVEAPCGSGKGIASLVPACHNLAEHGGKLIYVTAGIALQEQLITKDLPDLMRILKAEGRPEWVRTFEIAKGFSNYVCKERLADAETELLMKGARKGALDEKGLQELVQLEALFAQEWIRGDVSELPFEMLPNVRRLSTISREDCIGKRCEHFVGCYPREARKLYGGADIIVTNYHLYFIDLALKAAGAKGPLPEHRLLVMDEADQAADIARKYFGTRLSPGTVKTLAGDLDAKGRRAEKLQLPTIDPDLKASLITESAHFFRELEQLKSDKKRYQARLNKPGMIDGTELQSLLHQAGTAYATAAESSGIPSEARDYLRSRSEGCLSRMSAIRHARELDREGWIAYIDGEAGQRLELASEPVDAREFLKAHLFERKAGAPGPSGIVCCSATLATGTGDDAFEFTAGRLGIQEGDELIVESPFDFSRTALIVPRHMPEPNEASFADCVGETLSELVSHAEGRTLGLFTSYRIMNAAYERLRGVRFPYTILKQGDAPRTELIRRFKEDRQSVLLGTDSFWTGVDVPGDACIALLIDRIPFAHFDDPVLDAVKQENKNWFGEHYLPEAVLQFKQGFGRLVRSVGDFGVVVCCDRRITTKGYGRAFRRALPKQTGFSDRMSDVPALLEKFRSGRAHGLKVA